MLRSAISFALTRRAFTLISTILLCAAGGFALLRLPIDAFPNISPVQVKIIMKAPGMTPEEVETRVITPLELELLGIQRQTILRSAAKYAIADITIDFDDGTDIYWARQQVAERLANARSDLPATVTGGLAPISTPLSEVFMFTIEGTSLSLEEKRTLLDWTIRPALRTIPGVADVNSLGGYVRSFVVSPSVSALAAAGLGVADLIEAIQTSNRNDGAGKLVEGEKGLVVRAEGALTTAEDIGNIVLRVVNGRVLRISDVAEVSIGSITRYGGVTKDGKGEAVEGLVLSLRGADAGQVTRAVRARLAELQPSLPEGITLDIFYDRSHLIDQAVGTVEKALIEATVLVVILLLAFLANLRAAVVVAVTLPAAALGTFAVMYMLGMSANLMSLGGLAIAIGLIVDGSIVVVENCVEHLSDRSRERLPVLNVIYRSAAEVATPVASGIVIICIVFLPLLSLQGLEGKLFSPVAITIVIALAISLVLSLTAIPVLCAVLLRRSHHGEPWLMRKLNAGYRALLSACLARPYAVYAVAIAGAVGAIAAYQAVGKSFMPSMDEGSVIVQVTKLPSVSLDRSIESDKTIQRALLARVPEIKSIVARVGSDELGLDPMGPNETDTFLVLKPKSEWRQQDKDWLVDQIRTVLHDLPGADFAFTQPIEMRTSEMLTGARGDLAVKIFGPDIKLLSSLAGQIKAAIAAVNGASEVVTVSNEKVDYLELKIDRLTAGRVKLSVNRIEEELRALIEGSQAGLVVEPGRRTPIIVRGVQSGINSPEAFGHMQLVSGDGGLVRAAEVARLERTRGPVKLDRENSSRFALVQAYVSGRDLVGFVADAQAAVASKVELPPGYRLVWGGEFENQQRAAARLAIVVPIALGLIVLVVFATLRSIKESLLILANVPFAMVGGILSLWLSGEYLSVPASVGFIALLGIAVLNGLVLINHFNALAATGAPIERIVLDGAVRRLRPVLMTATIAACGLVPLLFASGPGSEIQRPLAIVVIGGLVTSTSLTLILLPILFRKVSGAGGHAAHSGGARWKRPFAS